MTNELYHHGIKGMKWGVRRFQNKDGTSKKKKPTYKERLSTIEKNNKQYHRNMATKIKKEKNVFKKASLTMKDMYLEPVATLTGKQSTWLKEFTKSMAVGVGMVASPYIVNKGLNYMNNMAKRVPRSNRISPNAGLGDIVYQNKRGKWRVER